MQLQKQELEAGKVWRQARNKKKQLLFYNQKYFFWPLFEFFVPLDTSVQVWRVTNKGKSLVQACWQKLLILVNILATNK